ncbi:hypothetical protein Syun_017721 [Stephania yunnanensis]|uniref:Uncharacterized protein n=1 Tax=Stephania yunnanensis TaxID=152371 RepID=A0AAP0J7F4_9MAGN
MRKGEIQRHWFCCKLNSQSKGSEKWSLEGNANEIIKAVSCRVWRNASLVVNLLAENVTND